jgi:hypothetical protein
VLPVEGRGAVAAVSKISFNHPVTTLIHRPTAVDVVIPTADQPLIAISP